MAFYRNISMSFWTDSKVDDDFTPEDKYFFLYLMTNPHTNICGCYEISMKQMERESGYNTDTVKRLLNRMENTHNVIRYCESTKEVLIINWGKYNWSESDKVKKAVSAVAEHIKHEQFKKYIMDRLSIGYAYGMDSVSIDYGTIYTDTDTDTVTESDTVTETENRVCADKPQKRARFSPPSISEVQSYCQERQNNVDAQRFVDYYMSNGWKVGKNAMKDWKAAVRQWERNGIDTGSKSPQRSSPDDFHNESFSMSELDALFEKNLLR